ncbi:MAG: phosphoribosyl-ATP diphosphatase [Bacteroidales bacterium]|nr:phosphoribosyl-ATP diphosphatase [Bacteroidales bacterium]MDD2425888.1 phosphoribosyl-ATP diphosphatase [Bacteroidales bacterium]MDD3990156.1 phosphoribosyl-ATP diphosphatase [Bacteroidales bacterium]MDD4639697.1 phosphoribosyl-ATP diphosphatase [Bacteroidales bacterium]
MKNFNELDFERNGNGLIPAIVQDVKSLRVLMLGYMSRGSLAVTLEKGLVTFYSRSRKVLWTKGETSGNFLRLVSIDTDCDGDTLLIMAEPTGNICHKGTFSCFDKDCLGENNHDERYSVDYKLYRKIGTESDSDANAGTKSEAKATEKETTETTEATEEKASAQADSGSGVTTTKNDSSGLTGSEVVNNLISTIRERHGQMPEGSYTAALFKKGVPAIAQKVGEEAVEVVIEAVKGDRERLVYELADLIYHMLVLMEGVGITTNDIDKELQARN